MSKKVRWGILGAGSIANAFADGVIRSQTGELAAVGSRSQAKADEFAAKWGGMKAYGNYESLLADPQVDAIYVATPHPMHPQWAIRAAEAGKHVLVEKPLGINSYLAETIIEAARANGVFLMEGYMYRCHPQTKRVVELIKEGIIGEIATIQACFSFQAGFNPDSRLWSNALAGGGILDVGGYPVSYARMIAGAAAGKSFENPVALEAVGNLHPETGVDRWTTAVAKFESGIVATLATGVGIIQDNVVRIYGTKGNILVPNPYVHSRSGAAPGKIVVRINGEEEQVIAVDTDLTSYVYEADVCGEAILAGWQEAAAPAMTWEDTLNNLRVQDQWRAAIGLQYESESIGALTVNTPAGRPLARPDKVVSGIVKGLDKPLSRLVMGVDNQSTMPHAQAIFDDYFERGGNTFDTAFVYQEIRSRLIGEWIRARGVRDDVVVIAKGAHTPHCNPESIVSQLEEQLGWMGLDRADIYMMHRDNPDIPVGEFVDIMNELADKGLFKAFGGSNWTLERVREANEYAERKGVRGFTLVSNNFSLAEMVNPVWGGCLHSRGADYRAYLKESGVALLPWSSQARGFFVPERARPDLKDDPSLVNSWYSDDNFRRQARVFELAEKKGCSPVALALAWVLHQPFAVFPLIGPRHISETSSSFTALDVVLNDDELRYLDLED